MDFSDGEEESGSQDVSLMSLSGPAYLRNYRKYLVIARNEHESKKEVIINHTIDMLESLNFDPEQVREKLPVELYPYTASYEEPSANK